MGRFQEVKVLKVNIQNIRNYNSTRNIIWGRINIIVMSGSGIHQVKWQQRGSNSQPLTSESEVRDFTTESPQPYVQIQFIEIYIQDMYPANTTHWNNVGSMLAHRLRRWLNIKPTLFQCVVFAGYTVHNLYSLGPFLHVIVCKTSKAISSNVLSFWVGNWNGLLGLSGSGSVYTLTSFSPVIRESKKYTVYRYHVPCIFQPLQKTNKYSFK